MDKNMNETGGKNLQNGTKKNDLEMGKSTKEKSSARTELIIAIVLMVAVFAGACTISALYSSWQTAVIVFFCLVVIFFFSFTYRWWYVAIRTAPRDFSALWNYSRLLRLAKSFEKKKYTIPDIFHDLVKKQPNKPCILFEEEVWTFKQLEEYSLRATAVFKAQGIVKEQNVGVLMGNCPEMPATWMGLARLGAYVPLINTNQRGKSLLHSIKIVDCDAVVFGSEFEDAIDDIRAELKPNIKLFMFKRRPLSPNSNEQNAVTTSDGKINLTSLLESTPPATWFKSDSEGFSTKMLYIYTSGTTGMPKAAIITSAKMVFMSSAVHFLGGLSSKDIVYCPMPLYHSAGGIVSLCQCLVFGCTLAIRAKFSASSFFPDCIKYNATAAHYLGEMCRYILTTKPAITDKQHKVRTVYGNGMRPAIWIDFVKRFNIKNVREFYGATEGNANIINNDNTPGAIGFISRIIPAVYPIAILKIDEATGDPIRNKRGYCVLAKPNEPGVVIGKITANNPSRVFMGYADKDATEKKIVRNIFSKGDSAFLSGDILVADDFGYLFFKDRTGDTFRWRGENVSTTEVEAAISAVADQRDAAVYGVEVPNIEGRAGMCAIVDPNDDLDLDKLAKDIEKDIPFYARPVFLRVMKELDMTATYKMKKVDLQNDGYNPLKINEKLYYLDVKLGKYVPLGTVEFQKINTGEIRL